MQQCEAAARVDRGEYQIQSPTDVNVTAATKAAVAIKIAQALPPIKTFVSPLAEVGLKDNQVFYAYFAKPVSVKSGDPRYMKARACVEICSRMIATQHR